MPRQRKPQSGVARAAGRVANTTTSLGWKDIANTNPKVYRIPTWGMRTECPSPLSEVGWVSPISVRREGNVFYVSLPEENLKSAIEGMSSLDLSNTNVSLNEVNWPLEISGSITTDWDITWQAINWTDANFDSVTATTWNITNVVSSDITTTSLTAEDASLDGVTITNNATVGWTLGVTWNTTLGGDLAVSWNETVAGDLDVTWATSTGSISASTWDITTLTSTDITTNTITVNDTATVSNGLTVTWGVNADTITTSWNATIGWALEVTWVSEFTGDVLTNNITSTWTANLNDVVVGWNETVAGTLSVTWATTLNNSLTVAWASTLSGNASVGGNLSVAGNSTVTGNQTVTGDAIFSNDMTVSRNLNVSGDATITDDLIVNGSTHLKTLETTGSASIAWNLSVDWSIAGWSNLVVENQIESGSLVTTNITTDNITINGNIALWNDATAPDFVLQDEKWQPNGVAPLDANWKVDPQYLPPVYTTAIVKMWTWVFSNSDTSVVVDADITADSFVAISNYSDIIWDLNEVINVWQLTVVSNQTETGSYKYIIVNPIS